MYREVQLGWIVLISPDDMDANVQKLKRAIIEQLQELLASKKASKELGYYVAVTTLNKIGKAKINEDTGEFSFPVLFNGITFKISKGEIVEGVVHKVTKFGVFLECGPIKTMYLSFKEMPDDYKYIPGENPCFMNEKNYRIQVGAKVRVVVTGTKWIEEKKEFKALVGLKGDDLGPISEE